ncbi:hypothetical protein AUEXF2481DRAFT_82287 [Aureobasidium subglaciale EXF-2481]|uniref:Acyltransferase 3 domain-containing protein n=1 Tax=Aureobasidium subglaciale (strain EXF-2481) TaxID=1043005 RepID=A0A074YEQ1_AURSE|nr:uncharacterized protein AUEXF2481DRAFT_82287 [Aureobasidium subglaciale EXF-2481]KAI5197059.1 hypothetical protein E4T38_08172 [Aureobasidium subglaciale]KAI5215757.1 hypothetical protein E4T40_08182 [Aureobasidium subglaciale]KAI5219009.1 hypothetical protein E4T41_08097 [Aureobasidium subglaciale]KAI5256579.1 hypothetical protein E4T46_08073 [Aureobasidium subglaciale]KEQ92577.1 hypothetical protein AUEXF2481DRAFT_82287 [Aureobasidium subglaciale EXF-2481]
MGSNQPQNYMAFRRKSSVLSNSQDHLWGIRAILAVQSFAWLFFKVFNPTLTVPAATATGEHVPDASPSTVPGVFGGPGIVQPGAGSGIIARDLYARSLYPRANLSEIPSIQETSPHYQVLLRKILSPLLWDESFIFCFFILLSARTVAISFLRDVNSASYARSLIARPIRMGWPLGVGLAISCIIFKTIDTQYLEDFARINGNPYLRAPENPASALACFNSIWNLLWVTKDYSLQMGNLAFPSWTLWVPSAIYLQSYTVYIFMVILPYSRPSWHVTGLLMFAFGSWWFNSWGWYSATGLFLADVAINPPLRTALFRGWSNESGSVRMPYWSLAVVFLGIGTGLKYMWTAGLDQLYWSGEAHAHPARYLGGSSFGYFDGKQPYPRMDNWLVIVGLLVLLEFSEAGKKILGSKIFKTIGRRSLSYYLVSTLLMYTAGIKIFLYCYNNAGYTPASSKAVAFFVVLPASIIAGEIFHWAIDKPAVWAGHAVYAWTRT